MPVRSLVSEIYLVVLLCGDRGGETMPEYKHRTLLSVRLANRYIWFFLALTMLGIIFGSKGQIGHMFATNEIKIAIAVSGALVFVCYFIVGSAVLVVGIALQMLATILNVGQMILEGKIGLEGIIIHLICPLLGLLVITALYNDAIEREKRLLHLEHGNSLAQTDTPPRAMDRCADESGGRG